MANFHIPIAFLDEDELEEFVHMCSQFQHEVEEIVIRLEKNNQNMELVMALRYLFEGVLYSSVKLSLTPISESLSDTVKALETVLGFKVFPRNMTEFLLLITDRIVLMVRDASQGHMLDIKKTQQPLVALSRIYLCDSSESLDDAVESAFEALAKDLDDEENQITEIELFGESESDSTSEVADVDDPPDTHSTTTSLVDIFVSHPENVVEKARDFIRHELYEHPALLIGDISDATTAHGVSHSDFLLEIVLGINFLIGEELDSLGLAIGVCFHDIALAKYPDILNKPGRLSQDELAKVKTHPADGFTIVSAFTDNEVAHEAVLHHHERVDGSGYPYALTQGEISPAGKMLAIADSFHAMTERRPHKKFTKNILRAAAEINALSGKAYDDLIVKMFNHVLRKHWLALHAKDAVPRQEATDSKTFMQDILCMKNFDRSAE